MTHIDKPKEGEYGPHDEIYIGLVPDDGNLLAHLEENLRSAMEFFRSIPDEKLSSRYAEGKWTVKEVLGHIIDTERIYGYRILRFARNDSTELPGFDQDGFVNQSHADRREIGDMLDELAAVRASSVMLLKGLDADAMERGGIASGRRLTVRAAAYILAGHEQHHITIIKERYL
ncbi:MAG: DinB family protein [Acidobacteriota bacterium]